MSSRGKVPHFSMRPHPVITGALIFVPTVGLLIAMSFFAQEEGTGIHRQHGMLAVIITVILTFCLLVLATSKLWFTHLWKKNSTHARHKQHTKYHPAVKQQQFRSR
jgi:uncharacterized protein YacL